MRARAVILTLAAMAGLAGGCRGMEGDCSITIRFEGVAYRPVAVVLTPRAGQRLGRADRADCDGGAVPGLGQVPVFAWPGQDSELVVLSRERGREGVYVKMGLALRDWPTLLKVASRFPACEGPATFSGSWDLIDVASRPNLSDYDVTVPYTGSLTATRGDGLHLDQWSSVQLQAQFTTGTHPQPDEQFVEAALAEDRPVIVTTTCHGTRFEVASIRLAD